MKRITIVLLSVLLVASLFVSCKVEVDDPMADLVSIRFTDDDGSKGLNVSVPGLDEYTWYYKANKNSADGTGLKTGATGEDFVIIGGETGSGKLSEKAGPFSQGLWDFELQARNGESIVYTGKVSAVSVNKETTTVKVVVEPSQTGEEGYLVIPKNIPLYDATNNVATNYKMVVSITNLISGKTVDVANMPTDNNYEKYSLKPASYRVSLTYQSEEGTYIYGSSETVVTIYSNMTTTLGGSVDENTSNVTFGPDGTIVVAPTEITTNNGVKEVTVTGSPADETKTTTVNFGDASGSITDGAKLSATMYPRQAAAKGFSVTDGNGVVLAGIDLKVEANGTVVSNFDGKAVTVSTYIGTGYDKDDLYVVYAGTGDQPTSCSYDSETGIITFTTTHFSSFYVVNTAVVAINETQNVFYKTLQEAVNAAKDGDVIVLLRDASGDGVMIESGKKLTIDFNGFTYIVDGKLVGSYGTKNQGFQLLKDSNITLKNGKILSGDNCTEEVKDSSGKLVANENVKASILIQNYCNLTLDDISLDGSNLVSYRYTLSNNCGDIKITGNTNIIAPSDGCAFDVYFWQSSYPEGVSVTFDEEYTGKVKGKIKIAREKNEVLSKKHSLIIEAGDFDEAKFIIDSVDEGSCLKIKSSFVKSSQFESAQKSTYYAKKNNDYYVLAKREAKIGDDYYNTLSKAVSSSATGDTIVLLADINQSSSIRVIKGERIVIDLNGHGICFQSSGNLFLINGGSEVEFIGVGVLSSNQNVFKIQGTSNNYLRPTSLKIGRGVKLSCGETGIFIDKTGKNVGNGVSITMSGTIDSGVFDTGDYGIYVNGTITGSDGPVPKIVLDSSSISGKSYGIYAAGNGIWTIKGNSKITGEKTAIEVRAGHMTIEGGEFVSNSSTFSCEENADGTTTIGAAIAVAQHTTKLPIEVNISGGKFSGYHAMSVMNPEKENKHDDSHPDLQNVEVKVTGGVFSANGTTDNGSPVPVVNTDDYFAISENPSYGSDSEKANFTVSAVTPNA